MRDFFCYTFLNNKLIGSENPSVFGSPLDKAKEFCNHYDIKHMITLTQDYNEFKIDGLSRYHVPMLAIPPKQDIVRLFSIIDQALAKDEAIWVHCTKGIDRTGCVIGAYLVHKGHDPENVIKELLLNFKKRLSNPKLEMILKDNIAFIRSFKIKH